MSGTSPAPISRVLLLSGGVDSAALAAWRRPDVTLFIDYGQRPRKAERRAAMAVARELGLAFHVLEVDLSPLGGGLLHDDAMQAPASDPATPVLPDVEGDRNEPEPHAGSGTDVTTPSTTGWPSPEWWPYRNQLLVTFAAAWATKHVEGVVSGHRSVIIETGTVASDGDRHADGTAAFYRALDDLLALQEGTVRAHAPAIDLSTAGLIAASGVDEAVLGWTHSCHRGDAVCGECPGCYKRAQLLNNAGRFDAIANS